MTAIWMGLTSVTRERKSMAIDGDRGIASARQGWLGLGLFAVQNKLVS